MQRYVREYWTGDSRDGKMENGDGYHYYRMSKEGRIEEAYEFYETDEGEEVVCPLPEMQGVHWVNDLGFQDFDALDAVTEQDFEHVRSMTIKKM